MRAFQTGTYVRPLAARLRTRHPVSTVWALRWRVFSTRSKVASGDVKDLTTILREMNARMPQRDTPRYHRPKDIDFTRASVAGELNKPLRAGDVVLVNSELMVIVGTPRSPEEQYVLANRSGKTVETRLTSIEARLLSLIPPHVLASDDAVIYAPDETSSRIVNLWLYRLISTPLRTLAEQIAHKSVDTVQAIGATMSQIQTNKPQILPLLALAASTMRTPARDLSIAEFCAVRSCLEHYTLLPRHLLNLSYGGDAAVTIVPKDAEKRNIAALHSRVASNAYLPKLVTDYAERNLPRGESESRAIEALRKQFPELKYVDPSIAADHLNLSDGGIREDYRFFWVFDAPTVEVEKGQDRLANVRERFEEPVYCIDAAGAHEIDDGISLKAISPTRLQLGIHIANPSAFLSPNVVEELLGLPTSVYLGDGSAIRMLPQAFTESIHLVPTPQGRPALSVLADLNIKSGAVSGVRIVAHTLGDIVNITPDDAATAIPQFSEYQAAASRLIRTRFESGAVEQKQYDGNDVSPLDVEPTPQMVVQEFMLLASNLVAEFCQDKRIPNLYRNQRLLLESPQIRTQFDDERKAARGLVGLKWRSITQRSRTELQPDGHASLGFGLVSRFTSPLRRLTDLCTHFQLEAHLQGGGTTPALSVRTLERVRDRMSIAEPLTKNLMRSSAKYEMLKTVAEGDHVHGIVAEVDIYTARVSVYVPKYGMMAEYEGARPDFRVEDTAQFVVSRASPAGLFMKVVLESEHS